MKGEYVITRKMKKAVYVTAGKMNDLLYNVRAGEMNGS